MLKIETVTRYTVMDMEFPTMAKAVDHIENRVNQIVTRAMLDKGFTASEAFKVTEILLAQRLTLANLLGYVDLSGDKRDD